MPYDLHTHSTASDGTTSPAQVVRAAAAAGLTGLALTDHDTGAGLVEAAATAQEAGVDLLPGVEISTSLHGRSVHLLGYGPITGTTALAAVLAATVDSRHGRLRRIVERLRAVVPELTLADVVARVPHGVTPGRPHIADALVAVGAVPDRDAAFAELLAEHGPYYVGYRAPDLVETVRLVVAAGGAPVVAHPGSRSAADLLDEDAGDRARRGRSRRSRGRPPGPRRAHPRAAAPDRGAARAAGHRGQRLPRRGQAEPPGREHHRRRRGRRAALPRGGGRAVNWQLFGEAFVTLFVIIDPPGTVPIFLGLTSTMTTRKRRRAARQAVLVAFGVIVAFAVFGQTILDYLGISLPALQAAGGLLLLLVALELLTDNAKEPEAQESVNIALVPLGTPLLAGPGAIVATMLFVQRADGLTDYVSVAAAIVAVHVVLFLVLRFAGLIRRVLRDGGVTLVTRIAGVLLSAIAVQLVADAVRAFVEAT